MATTSLAVPALACGAVASAAGAAWLFLSAIATASLRDGYCGPTTLDHVEPHCRMGTKLLLASCGVGILALVLAATATGLGWRRKGPGRPAGPDALRPSA